MNLLHLRRKFKLAVHESAMVDFIVVPLELAYQDFSEAKTSRSIHLIPFLGVLFLAFTVSQSLQICLRPLTEDFGFPQASHHHLQLTAPVTAQ